MRGLATSGVVAALALCVGLAASPAQALALRAFVSGTGSDAAGCGSRTAPCRSFQFVHHNVVAAGGEIDVLDSAGYGPISITKSLSIVNDGAGTAGVATPSGGVGIAINASVADRVFLKGLTIEGFGTGSNGILLSSGGTLTVVNCVARHFTANGILVAPASGVANVAISDTIASENGNSGIFFNPPAGGTAKGAISRTIANGNGNVGIFLNAASTATVVDSIATNDAFGFATEPSAVMRLGRSVASGNSTGVFVGSPVFTYGDNKIDGNINDFSGVATSLPNR